MTSRQRDTYTWAVTDDAYQRTTVRLPKELHLWVRMEALRQGVTAAELIITALQRQQQESESRP